MAIGNQDNKTSRVDTLPPLVSADSVSEGNYPRARFDDSIAWTIKETARKRSPTPESVWRHQIGFAGELATAAYYHVEADWSITEDFAGDEGHDLVIDGHPVEVKTVTGEEDWELKIPPNNIESADYFILARCSNPTELAELVGWIRRSDFHRFGYRFGDGLVRVGPEYLEPFEPIFIPPERIRASQGL